MPVVYRTLSLWIILLLTLTVASCAPVQQPTAGAPTAPQSSTAPSPNAIDYALYFNSIPQDDPTCTLQRSDDGTFDFGATVTNPAMTCPDAFAWKMFVEALSDEYWVNWAADQYTWPVQPLKLCGDGDDGTACCRPGSLTNPGYDNKNNPGISCPYFPGDHLAAGADPITHTARPPSKAHITAFSLKARDAGDPARVIRQEMGELVFRNKPMFDYVFTNNLYHTDGLADLFADNSQSMLSAPYRTLNTTETLTIVDLPVESVMIKSNWLSVAEADAMGLEDDPDNPYITMEIDAPILDNDAPDDRFEPGLYYLVSFHISSKDIPNWVWATFEHVNNPGRCDYIGCNDSFGYASPDAIGEGLYTNFTSPHVITDGLVISSPIFDTGGAYGSGDRSAALQAVFDGAGIGTEEQSDPARPSPQSRGWLSYRLKGSQINFTDATGRATLLGNSITEGGFVSTSSCMSCHARAAVNAHGGPPLGVFRAQLSEVGYPQSVNNVPDPDWYYSSSSEPSLLALQTDFVWGFLFAQPITTTLSTQE